MLQSAWQKLEDVIWVQESDSHRLHFIFIKPRPLSLSRLYKTYFTVYEIELSPPCV